MKRPKPTEETPTMDEIEDMVFDREPVRATDGCHVEPDGHCHHGHPSWLLVMGLL